ncbi:hypothetical protein BKP64_07660 [Marinobacter salinus]|uniref:Uncharacterized protein n=1 Tax=Marinobacter salinus TaxID=1874317 RepID=A0A1D9GK82_9GAMM|nr:hypothetical protein [Marinobacter salinus]AOY88056.1 hypothetical protein BKP64_07660 [Marinobacter salinus]
MKDQSRTKTLEFDAPKTEQEVYALVQNALKSEFQTVKLNEKKKKKDFREVYLRVRTKMLSPIISLRGPLSVQVKDNKARVNIDGKTMANRWYLFLFILCVFLPPLFLLLLMLFVSQKKSSNEAIDKVFERLEFDSSAYE